MSFNEIMIQCSAPSLCGIKAGNLFSIPSQNYSKEQVAEWKSIFKDNGLEIKELHTSLTLSLFYVYDFCWIRKLLEDTLISSYLAGKGYPVNEDCMKVLNELFYRLEHNKVFPHEVGIFLGYPIEDVIAFELHQGKNCKYCGYWKSYSNVDDAKKCCAKYNCCSQMCKKWFEEGYSIPQIIRKYKIAAKENFAA